MATDDWPPFPAWEIEFGRDLGDLGQCREEIVRPAYWRRVPLFPVSIDSSPARTCQMFDKRISELVAHFVHRFVRRLTKSLYSTCVATERADAFFSGNADPKSRSGKGQSGGFGRFGRILMKNAG
jgi:hypothetical protein